MQIDTTINVATFLVQESSSKNVKESQLNLLFEEFVSTLISIPLLKFDWQTKKSFHVLMTLS